MPLSDREPRSDRAALFAGYLDHYRQAVDRKHARHAGHLDISAELTGGMTGE